MRRSVACVWTLPSAPRGLERDYGKTIATKHEAGRLLPARQRRPAAFPDGYLESGSQETINQRGARPEGRATAIATVSVTAEGASGLCKAVGAGGGRGHVNKPHGCQGLRSALSSQRQRGRGAGDAQGGQTPAQPSLPSNLAAAEGWRALPLSLHRVHVLQTSLPSARKGPGATSSGAGPGVLAAPGQPRCQLRPQEEERLWKGP